MKIIVTKASIENREKEITNDIIEIAKLKASQGISEFTFKIPDHASKYVITNLVETSTEKTVWVPPKGADSNYVRFLIEREKGAPFR